MNIIFCQVLAVRKKVKIFYCAWNMIACKCKINTSLKQSTLIAKFFIKLSQLEVLMPRTFHDINCKAKLLPQIKINWSSWTTFIIISRMSSKSMHVHQLIFSKLFSERKSRQQDVFKINNCFFSSIKNVWKTWTLNFSNKFKKFHKYNIRENWLHCVIMWSMGSCF